VHRNINIGNGSLSDLLLCTVLMSEQERKEINAFISFFATFDLARPVTTVTDLSDGAALFDVLALVYVHSLISNARRN
jgi:hypothetical protein